jgi:hypothetical protein
MTAAALNTPSMKSSSIAPHHDFGAPHLRDTRHH